MNGTIKFFEQVKKFGYITPSTGGKDVFFHISGVNVNDQRNLADGASVEFETQEGKKGIEACNVRVL